MKVMSISKKVIVNCSKCGKPLEATVFDSINSNYADDLSSQIIDGKLFTVECPHCGFVSHLEYDILYNDMLHNAMIWVIHKNSPNYFEKINEVHSVQNAFYKTTRIVEDINALREKVFCLENNRDDRIIELCKVFTIFNLLSQKPDFTCKNAFYSVNDGKELICFYDNAGNELFCELPNEIYNHLEKLFLNSPYVTEFDNNFPVIDNAWAENIFLPLLKTEVNTEHEEKLKANEIICPKCKGIIPKDSEFCCRCGSRILNRQEQEKHTSEKNIKEANIEKESHSHIQQERNAAIQKRISATEASEKKKKTRHKVIFLIIFAIIMVFIVNAIRESLYNEKLRNFATEIMNDDYTNVYADIVSMEPEYFVYTTSGVNSFGITEIICKCKTVEGKTIWATIDTWKYPGGSSRNEENNKPYYYNKSDPLRLSGSVTTASEVVDGLDNSIGDVFVLDVYNLDDK